jgi:transposase
MSKKQSPQKHRKHTAEFKAEALKLAGRVGVAEAAEKLGLHASQVYGWRAAFSSTQTLSERESQQATEIARLKRQLAEQAEELEILKKAATYFAKHQK